MIPPPLPTQTLKVQRPHGKNSQKTCFQGMSPDLPPSGGVTLNSFQHMLLSRWGELEKLEVSIVKIIARILKKPVFRGGALIYLL